MIIAAIWKLRRNMIEKIGGNNESPIGELQSLLTNGSWTPENESLNLFLLVSQES